MTKRERPDGTDNKPLKLELDLELALQALESIVNLCKYNGDFRNGNTHLGLDEGEVLAGNIIDQAEATIVRIRPVS